MYKNSDMKLGERLRQARKEAGMTQTELARRAGISQPTLSDIENGNIAATTVIVALARATGVNAAWLAEERGPMKAAEDMPVELAQTLPDWIELARFSPLIPSNAALQKIATLYRTLDEAFGEAALTRETFELMLYALKAQFVGVSEQEIAPVRQILNNTIELRQRAKETAHASIGHEPASQSDLDRKAIKAASKAIPGATESENARAAVGGHRRKRH